MKILESIRKTAEKVINFLTEDVEEDDKVEEVRQEVRKTAQQIEVMEKKMETAAVQRPAETVSAAPAEKPVRPSESSTFVDVTPAERKPAEQPKAQPSVTVSEPIREKESVYIKRNVISPIFGKVENSTERYSTSPMVQYDDDVQTESVIGTIFSPINGRYVPAQESDDEIDDEVARLTTTDFIEKISSEPEEYPVPAYLDAEYNTVSVQDMPVIPQDTEQPEVIRQPAIETITEPPVIRPAEIAVSPEPVVQPLKEEEDEDGYVNLSLF
ncbi:MAG: hypothetical protein K6A14_06010 [Erysipelotrichaceae bacterium]|nr:hypothetical protein [Erysipelotrichaceae bacterium]